jgi:hypothetical protein
MTVCRNDKALILKAYLEKLISKDQMEMLINEGINLPPIPWNFDREEVQIKDSEKRELISRIFGISHPKLEWV